MHDSLCYSQKIQTNCPFFFFKFTDTVRLSVTISAYVKVKRLSSPGLCLKVSGLQSNLNDVSVTTALDGEGVLF